MGLYPKADKKSNQFSFRHSLKNDYREMLSLVVSSSGVRSKQIFDSLIQTYHKLIKLGFTYYNGNVAIIESSEEDSNE
jgi:hypothetical protein